MQDYCFVLAKQIAEDLDCLVIISMREERFYYSRFHGTLDAFQTSGFHQAARRRVRFSKSDSLTF